MKSLAMYQPVDSVRTLVDIDRLINSFFGSPAPESEGSRGGRYPLVDVLETNDAYVFEAALPGYMQKDIEVNIDGNTLTIESKKDSVKEKTEKNGNYIFRERHAEAFSRAFKLPDNADSTSVSADFTNGLLSLTIKKRAESQKRVIEISGK